MNTSSVAFFSHQPSNGCRDTQHPNGGKQDYDLKYVDRMRHNRNRRPYELRICDKCDWHSVEDEEHILHFAGLSA
jgi:hypothetical protein